MNLKNINEWLIVIGLLAVIAYISVWVRMGTYNAEVILDYDPWWFYRHAKEILENNMQPPQWDLLSFFPPGRPTQPAHGWTYLMVIFYRVISFFTPISFMDAVKLAPVIMVALTVIPAFFLGKLLSNKWAGVATALFATLAPTFIGVSMAGYSDTDAPVVFYSFLVTYVTLLAIVKRKIPYYILAVILNLVFIFTWFFGWYVIFFLLLSIPALFIFMLIEQIVHNRNLRLDTKKAINELKPIAISIIAIFIALNALAVLLGMSTILTFIIVNFGFVSGTGLIVNISVAELQVINIFTKGGFFSVIGRVGLAPTLFTLFGLPLLVMFKLYKKVEIHFAEIFLFLWTIFTFYMILHGVRFSLQFSVATAIVAGYVIGEMAKYLKKNVIAATAFGFTLLLALMFISDAIQIGYASAGMQVSQNWIDMLDWLKENADEDALIATWWDPGHIIAGYTGLKVHADGAHCGPAECYPYNHDTRIQDMGRIFSTSSEDEAISILKKYTGLTSQQCQEVKKKFGNIVPEEACKPISEMYLIASADLIGKYYWMSFFGTGTGRNFFQLPFSNFDQTQGIINYAGGTVSLVRKEDQWVPVYQNRYVINEVVYFENGETKQLVFQNATNVIDGLLWIDPSYNMAIFMEPTIKDSLFTRMFFFNGQGLERFQLVYSNAEIRLFKVIL
ncbi:MAG: STT3 domain-containing protein [Methanosarcinales archaeon]